MVSAKRAARRRLASWGSGGPPASIARAPMSRCRGVHARRLASLNVAADRTVVILVAPMSWSIRISSAHRHR